MTAPKHTKAKFEALGRGYLSMFTVATDRNVCDFSFIPDVESYRFRDVTSFQFFEEKEELCLAIETMGQTTVEATAEDFKNFQKLYSDWVEQSSGQCINELELKRSWSELADRVLSDDLVKLQEINAGTTKVYRDMAQSLSIIKEVLNIASGE